VTEPKKKRKTAARYREDWLDRKWRPAMGWMYLVVCITDFIIFPILHSWMQVRFGTPTLAWDPLTLKGGGLFHVAMGAVLGVAAWSRGQEKITKYQTGYYNRSGYDDGYGNEYMGEELVGHEESYEARPLEPVANTETEFYRFRR
jgi:hypothetical protein